MAKKNTSPIYYETQYANRGKLLTYRTKSLTPMHESLRKRFGGMTLKCNTSISWAFGIWSEVIAEEKPAKK